MQFYYHRTDGGAEYYSFDHLENSDEGIASGVVMRTDGNEIEIFTRQIEERGINLVIN